MLPAGKLLPLTRHRPFLLSLVLPLLLGLTPLQAEPVEAALSQQRQDYQKALQAVRQNDHATLEGLLPRLENYPLYPYLSQAYLVRQFDTVDSGDIENFLADWGSDPIGLRLLSNWLDYLRSKDRWQDFIRFYPAAGSPNPVRACYYHEALLRAGRREEAIAGGLELWNVARSQPNECDALFDQLIALNVIDEAVAWQRLQKVLAAGHTGLARYLTRFLETPARREAAEAQIALAANSALIARYDQVARIPWPEREASIRRALAHLARTDAPAALRHWRHYRQSDEVDVATHVAVLGPLVRGHHQQNRSEAADRLLRDQLEFAEASLIEWRLRHAIRHGQWATVRHWIDHLPREVQQHERWRYWRVRAAELDDVPLADADEILASLATSRSFYGFVAAQRLGLPYRMEHRPATPQPHLVEQIRALPAVARARELLHLEEFSDARREWHHAGRHFSDEQWIAAAHLATEWQRYQFAINAMIAAGYWDDIELRFPLAWREAFQNAADRYGISPISLMAIARQESAFGTDVVSPAGARGLMQLMPATARETAQRAGLGHFQVQDLFRPDVNLRLGSAYFNQLLVRFDNNRILAAAGYNAGPGRVRSWRRNTAGQLPVDAWIEAIPFAETRQYVQNILSFSVIYAHRLGADIEMLSTTELETPL